MHASISRFSSSYRKNVIGLAPIPKALVSGRSLWEPWLTSFTRSKSSTLLWAKKNKNAPIFIAEWQLLGGIWIAGNGWQVTVSSIIPPSVVELWSLTWLRVILGLLANGKATSWGTTCLTSLRFGTWPHFGKEVAFIWSIWIRWLQSMNGELASLPPPIPNNVYFVFSRMWKWTWWGLWASCHVTNDVMPGEHYCGNNFIYHMVICVHRYHKTWLLLCQSSAYQQFAL